MNAKYLTVIFSASLLLCAKFVLMPEMAKGKSLKAGIATARTQAVEFREVSQMVKSIPATSVQVQPIDVSMTTSVAGWYARQREYGLFISSIMPKQVSAAENATQLSVLKQRDELTGLEVSRMVIKGNYTSLSELQRFVSTHLTPSNAVAIDEVLMQGDSFEITATIYGAPA